MRFFSRIGTASVSLFVVAAACGDRTGLPIQACAGEPLARVSVPNIYFILDRSSSMNQAPGGATASTTNPAKWQLVRDNIAALMTAVGGEAQFGAAVFPPVGADSSSCLPGAEVMALTLGDGRPATTAGSTANVFLNDTVVGPDGGTPTAATFFALATELTSFKGHTFAILATDGGPDCNTSPDFSCEAATCAANISGLPGSDCCSAGTNCCAPGVCVGARNCLDDVNTVAAIAALAHPQTGSGVPTFVIGIPGSDVEPYPQVLDRMAVAGGTARATEPLYYPVDAADSKSLVSALADIARRIAVTCDIELEDMPADPTQVNVVLGGRLLPQEGPNGWTISGNFVTVLGASCDKVHAVGRTPVVTGGCPTLKVVADAGVP